MAEVVVKEKKRIHTLRKAGREGNGKTDTIARHRGKAEGKSQTTDTMH